MTIFLTVLRIIGIVLLVVILLALLILGLVLFVPIRYRVSAHLAEHVTEEDSEVEKSLLEDLNARVSVTWLLHLIRGSLAYPQQKQFTLKVLCFTLYPRKAKPEKQKKTKKAKKPKQPLETEKPSEPEKPAESGKPAESEKPSEPEKPVEPEQAAGKEDAPGRPEAEEPGTPEEEAERPTLGGFLELLENGLDKLLDFVTGKLPDTLENVASKIGYTICGFCDRIEMIRAFLDSPVWERARDKVLKHLGLILRMIRPRKFRARVLYGSGDPADTAELYGKVMAVLALFPADVQMDADFDRKVMGGDVKLHGRITIFRLVLSAAILYFNKDIRRCIRRIQKIKELKLHGEQ